MIQIKSLKLIFIIFLILGLLFIPNYIYAQQNGGLLVSPATQTITLAPAGSTKLNFNLTNKNDYDITFTLKKGEVINGKTIIDNDTEAFASKWLSFGSTGGITLKPQQSLPVELTVTLPATAPEGIYTLYAVAEVTSTSIQNSSQANLKEFLPFELILNVNEKNSFNSDVRVKALSIDKNPVIDSKFTINVTIANYAANTLSKPIAYFQVINPKGEVIKQDVINEPLAHVLGGATISKTFENSIDLFDYKNLGEFRAEVLVVDTLTQASSIQKVNFLVIPLPFAIFAMALILLVILLLLKVFRKKRKSLQ